MRSLLLAGVAVTFCLSGLPSRAGETGGDKIEALNYFSSAVGDSTHLYVFPTRRRYVDTVGGSEIEDAFAEYQKARANIYFLREPRSIVQIALIQLVYRADGQVDVASSIDRLTLPPSHKALIAPNEIPGNGCVAIKFLSRDAWADAGAVFVDTKRLAERGPLHPQNCVSRALDYLNGVPVRANVFDYLDFPSLEATSLLMTAIHECATEGHTDLDPPEESRDGITARPSKDCVSDKLR